ncbi:MAG: prolyl oligopeptidase family serine peptidase [Armatimonadetes bacterium]|nr:prolyl oligopeptidase family serine peptidase [Armatimonadota bacterium]
MLAAALLITLQPKTPLDFARAEVAREAKDRAQNVSIEVKSGGEKESYEIAAKNGKVRIVGSDPVGAMYGAFEFAERLHQQGDMAWQTSVKNQPFLKDRGLNLFLTLPWNYAKNDTDFDPAALTDPNRWWFQNENYWTTLLDQMAHARLNWLDIHGAWDISVTNAPNLYAYFVTSPSFPKVGVTQSVKDQDLRQLNHVIDMAHARGIRVSLMAYEANLKIPQNPNPGYDASEANIYKYTKEVVEQMIRRAPGLDAIGYRIGESGRSESFFRCYDEAVKASGRHIPIVTRSWITRKQRVLPLARASKDFTVEIKYNGEQWGAPYMVAGGRMANWYSYSYEDYLSDSGAKGVKTWPGNPATGGGNWPSEPYKIVWQVRANGTHRIFPFYNPQWVRRTIGEMKIGTASGYTIEGEDAYYPKKPDYYLANPADKYCDWIHQRDEMYWMTWGRLGYDPKTPDDVFDARAKELLGDKDGKLVDAWKEASIMVPEAYMAFSLGPDHRNHAPELEWGGDTNSFLTTEGFDSTISMSPQEALANKATDGLDARYFSAGYGGWLTDYQPKPKNSRAKEVANALGLELALTNYYEARVKGATSSVSPYFEDRLITFKEYQRALTSYGQIAANTYYRPFTERLRMHTNTFTWAEEFKKVQAEVAKFPEPQRGQNFPTKPELKLKEIEHITYFPDNSSLNWKVEGSMIRCITSPTFSAEKAFLKIKPLPSSTFFHRIPMVKVDDHFEATFRRERFGHAISAEVYYDGLGIQIPDADLNTPYLVVPSLPGPTPQIYNASEAMTYLKPSIITPDKFGAILIGSRAQNFLQFSKSIKRKLLEPVSKGMKLVILQQDFGKFQLDWLPKPLRVEAGQSDTFDPGDQLGLVRAAFPGAMWQRFAASDGWDIFGNGGLARLKYGQGEIWITTARLMQNMHLPNAAIDFVKLLSLGGKQKPTVLIDSCSEGGAYTSSCHPDLMNSHDIPFVTLGEAIAQEQGMDSFTPIPGPTMNDDVLEGQGQAIAQKFVRNQVIQMAKRPTPPNLTAFKRVRVERKKELMRSLGLDPMPPRTPLNARVTGTIARAGYHIEKVVFESRPKFYVTAHVYVPDRFAKARYPVIVNVNGHWAHKKDEDRIQLRCAFQALQGYVAIAIDSPGWSFEGNSLIERRAEGNHNDFKLVQGGANTTGYYVWDAMRALDYMATRPDTDMSRIGLTGASGGGLATLYTFAADDRYKAAVPVVYMASMELAPDNGCLCNHVPATSQIGDRSDVMAIQAPKPVYIMGAEQDGEFPPDATRLTVKKLKEAWTLFGKQDDVYGQIYAGGHDYNQLMRESSIGFFNKYLKSEGDGSPVPQPALQAIDPQDHQLLVLDPPLDGERTMRDLSMESLSNAPKATALEEFISVNGGRPPKTDMHWHENGTSQTRSVSFESEPGLITPGILVSDGKNSDWATIVVADHGKATEMASMPAMPPNTLFLDILGTGELTGFDLRYPVYAGRSVAFTGGWQIVRAAEAMRKHGKHVAIIGRGPLASQAVMVAGLLDPTIEKVMGYDCLKTWADVFRDDVPDVAIQPRANLCGSLDGLRKLVKHGEWHF